jgi:DNA-binding PadR family transcriptional regulator
VFHGEELATRRPDVDARGGSQSPSTPARSVGPKLRLPQTRNAYIEGEIAVSASSDKAGPAVPAHPGSIGELEQIVLLAILHLGDGAYAVPIQRELATRARRRIARGALYTTLERLEHKGYLRSRFGDPLPERGGRSRRYFSVTARGLGALRASYDVLRSMSRGLEPLLGDVP